MSLCGLSLQPCAEGSSSVVSNSSRLQGAETASDRQIDKLMNRL